MWIKLANWYQVLGTVPGTQLRLLDYWLLFLYYFKRCNPHGKAQIKQKGNWTWSRGAILTSLVLLRFKSPLEKWIVLLTKDSRKHISLENSIDLGTGNDVSCWRVVTGIKLKHSHLASQDVRRTVQGVSVSLAMTVLDSIYQALEAQSTCVGEHGHRCSLCRGGWAAVLH